MITMPKGGARAVSGPPPDPNALRRDRPSDQSGWTMLPADGRAGDAPAWPLVEASAREMDLWRDLWSRPQALMWERLDQRYEVAMFVRKLGEAEQPRASVELQKVVRQYLDSLGLSVQGMLRNRWRIVPAEDADEEETSSAASSERSSASTQKARLKVVSSGEGA